MSQLPHSSCSPFLLGGQFLGLLVESPLLQKTLDSFSDSPNILVEVFVITLDLEEGLQ